MRARINALSLFFLLLTLATTLLMAPVLIAQSPDALAVTQGNDWYDFFLLKSFLWAQVATLLLFAIWVSGVSGTYLNAPLLLVGSIFLWHLSFVVGFFLSGEGLFSYTGGVFHIGPEQILASIGFTGLCMGCAVVGIVYSYHFRFRLRPGAPIRAELPDPAADRRFSELVQRAGLIGLGLSAAVLIAYDWIEGRASSDVQYMELYTQASGSFIYRLFHSTQFFAAAFVLMVWSEKGSRRKLILGLLAISALVFLHFLNGSRSLPFIIMVAALVCYDNFIKRQTLIRLAGMGVGLSSLSWIVSQARGGGVGLHVFSMAEDQGVNLLHFFWEAGRTIGTVIMTMHFMANESYRLGTSFLSNVFEMLPLASNVIRDYVPVDRPSEWLVGRAASLASGEGFGFSMVAESFFNFGYLGCLVFLGLGTFIGRYYFGFLRTGSRYKYLVATIVAVMLTLHMRNDSGSYLRTLLISLVVLQALHRLSRLSREPAPVTVVHAS
jgi:oligosaccharide repeat unit polymerase